MSNRGRTVIPSFYMLGMLSERIDSPMVISMEDRREGNVEGKKTAKRGKSAVA